MRERAERRARQARLNGLYLGEPRVVGRQRALRRPGAPGEEAVGERGERGEEAAPDGGPARARGGPAVAGGRRRSWRQRRQRRRGGWRGGHARAAALRGGGGRCRGRRAPLEPPARALGVRSGRAGPCGGGDVHGWSTPAPRVGPRRQEYRRRVQTRSRRCPLRSDGPPTRDVAPAEFGLRHRHRRKAREARKNPNSTKQRTPLSTHRVRSKGRAVRVAGKMAALLTSAAVAGRATAQSRAAKSSPVAAAGLPRSPAQQAALPQMFSASQGLSSAAPCARSSSRLAARRRGVLTKRDSQSASECAESAGVQCTGDIRCK